MKNSCCFKLAVILLNIFLFHACNPFSRSTDLPGTIVSVSYADGFTIHQHDGYIRMIVKNPWDTAVVLQEYILVDSAFEVPENLAPGTLIRTPVQNIACLYGVHVGILERLDELESITAIAEPEYLNHTFIREKLSEGKLVNLGSAMAVDIEKLMDASPDLVLASPFQGMGYGNMGKCGIPIAEDASYMESTPLGRAEWIKFTAAFLGKLPLADSLFKEIEAKYLSLKDITAKVDRPTIFSEKKYGQAWYVPAGRSYMSYLFADAGCEYIWKDTPETGSLPLSQEVVYDKAENADFWVIKDANPVIELNYKALADENKVYTYFKAWKEKRIIYANTMTNHYYDKGVLEPDVILADLIRLIHPSLLPEHTPVYFKMLNE